MLGVIERISQTTFLTLQQSKCSNQITAMDVSNSKRYSTSAPHGVREAEKAYNDWPNDAGVRHLSTAGAILMVDHMS